MPMARAVRFQQAPDNQRRSLSDIKPLRRDYDLSTPTPHILLVDDDEVLCRRLVEIFRECHYTAEFVLSAEEALSRVEADEIDLVVTELRLPGLSGADLIEQMQQRCPDVPVIVLTGYADVDSAVEILKRGAADYIVKPMSAATLREATRTVVEREWTMMEIRHLRRVFKERYDFGGMVSKTPEMHRVFEVIRMVSATDVTVLVEGETGTGKELVASAIHHQSDRKHGPFVTINCAGVPDSLLEIERFGFDRGAFTGADHSQPGKIELANGGTLFLDEIESMSLAMQAKLLLVLQDRMVQRLGGTRRTRIDMRIVAATNVSLEELVAQGAMRRDFYYRINVVTVRLLPLRQRSEDIPLLVRDFLNHHPVARRKQIRSVSGPAMQRLMHYPWPGNVRELQNVLERALVLTAGHTIDKVDLPTAKTGTRFDNLLSCTAAPLREWLSEQERQYLCQQLQLSGGKIAITAANCGVDIKTLYRKMRFYGLDKRVYQQGDAALDSTSTAPSSREYDAIE